MYSFENLNKNKQKDDREDFGRPFTNSLFTLFWFNIPEIPQEYLSFDLIFKKQDLNWRLRFNPRLTPTI